MNLIEEMTVGRSFRVSAGLCFTSYGREVWWQLLSRLLTQCSGNEMRVCAM